MESNSAERDYYGNTLEGYEISRVGGINNSINHRNKFRMAWNCITNHYTFKHTNIYKIR